MRLVVLGLTIIGAFHHIGFPCSRRVDLGELIKQTQATEPLTLVIGEVVCISKARSTRVGTTKFELSSSL